MPIPQPWGRWGKGPGISSGTRGLNLEQALESALGMGENNCVVVGGVQLEGNKMHLLAAIVVEKASVQHRQRSKFLPPKGSNPHDVGP
jgi:hypothetical protein